MERKLVLALIVALGGTAWAQAQQPLSEHDRVRSAVQAICPVSGKPLGEHGPPIKVRVGKEVLFVCCRACLQGRINPQAWRQIHENFRRAQGICPVMRKPLRPGAKGAPVQGEMFYVCCPGCLKKISASPQRYLQWLHQQYRLALRSGNTRR